MDKKLELSRTQEMIEAVLDGYPPSDVIDELLEAKFKSKKEALAWARKKVRERMKDPEVRKRAKEDARRHIDYWRTELQGKKMGRNDPRPVWPAAEAHKRRKQLLKREFKTAYKKEMKPIMQKAIKRTKGVKRPGLLKSMKVAASRERGHEYRKKSGKYGIGAQVLTHQ